jgi:cytochrome c biogenesis protein CcdA
LNRIVDFASLTFAFMAGLVSIFAPCVLPLLPVVLGAAVSEHRFGPVALAAGLSLSFLFLGLFVATIGFAVGLDSDLFRAAAATLRLW